LFVSDFRRELFGIQFEPLRTSGFISDWNCHN